MVLKRTIDLAVGLLLMVSLAPLLVVAGSIVFICLGRPVFFRQVRTGLDGYSFEILKFRTMSNARDENGALIDEALRQTRVGRFLRQLSIDELPSLWNVVSGQMSLVGPRPLLPEYLPYYTHREHLRHSVRPGLTGWAQINGRNELPWPERLELDVWYVENRSQMLDAYILLRTLAVPFVQRGINQSGHATSPRLDDERRCGS
jgi:sugar transferase EpsL